MSTWFAANSGDHVFQKLTTKRDFGRSETCAKLCYKKKAKCIALRSHNSNITLGWQNQACNWLTAMMSGEKLASSLKSVVRVSRICKNSFSYHFRFHAETFDFDFQKEASHKMSQSPARCQICPSLWCPCSNSSVFPSVALTNCRLEGDVVSVGGCNAIRK